MHQPQLCERLYPLDVDGAPRAAELAWSELDCLAFRITALADAIDPVETQSLI